MKDLKLTDYGTIVLGNNEVKVDTFLELLKNCKGYFDVSSRYRHGTDFQDFVFNKDSDCFDIETYCYWESIRNYYCLKLSNKQKELLDQGRPSPELLKLFAFEEECQYKNRQKQIRNKFYETGELPTDPEELVIYNDILHQELAETKADIVKKALITTVVPTVFGASFLYISAKTGADIGFLQVFLRSSFFTFMPLVGFLVTENNPFPIGKIKSDIEKMEIIKEKINILNTSEEKRMVLEAEKSFTLEGLENQGVKDVAKNNNIFLQELDKIKKKIAKLPEEERKQYFDELVEIVRDYYTKVCAILDRDNNKIVLGDDANLWSVTLSMLPELFNFDVKIDQRLAALKEKEQLKSALEQIVDTVEPAATERGYTDGWTDGYSDDLTSGGVAYATVGNNSVASRKMA